MNDWKRQPNTFRKTEAETAVEQPAIFYVNRSWWHVHYTANFLALS